MSMSYEQRKLLAISPKVTGALSIVGSCLTIREIVKDTNKRSRPQFRILACMSICDVLSSFAFFLSTWAIPHNSDVYASRGNDFSCNLQGFFIQFGVAIPLYNCIFCIYHLLTIHFSWKESEIKSIEKFFHIIPLGFAAVTSVSLAAFHRYGNAILWCWISGGRVHLLRWTTFYGPIWVAILVSTIAMIMVYYTVRKTENRSNRWTVPIGEAAIEMQSERNIMYSERRKVNKQRPVAVQATLFLLAFLTTWLPSSLVRLLQMIGYNPHFILTACMAIILPCQGVLNCLVYNRPKWLTYRKQNAEKPFWNAIGRFWIIVLRGEAISVRRPTENIIRNPIFDLPNIPGYKSDESDIETGTSKVQDTKGDKKKDQIWS